MVELDVGIKVARYPQHHLYHPDTIQGMETAWGLQHYLQLNPGAKQPVLRFALQLIPIKAQHNLYCMRRQPVRQSNNSNVAGFTQAWDPAHVYVPGTESNSFAVWMGGEYVKYLA